MKMRFLFFSLLTTLTSLNLIASDYSGPVLQLGVFSATQGKSQHVDIDGLIGDDFSLKKSTDQNLLVGVGYYFDCLEMCESNILWGINAFYLAPTEVRGNVTQEDLFTNLSYHYSIINYPIYFATKAMIPCTCICNSFVTIDLGIGGNIIHAKGFREHSRDGGVTLPDSHLFSGKTSGSFSATAGIGWRINNVLNDIDLEINYRFFYLGSGELKKNNSQLENTIHTGYSYANAFFLSISI